LEAKLILETLYSIYCDRLSAVFKNYLLVTVLTISV